MPDITLKRGLISSKDWWEWINDIRKGGWVAQKKSVTIVLRDEAGEGEVGKWTLQNVAPVKYTGPSLNAKGGTDAAMEELVLSAEGIIYSES